MRNKFYFYHFNFKIFKESFYTWMCSGSGDGELESVNQGRIADYSFSQETVGKIKVQCRSRIDHIQTLLKSAGCTLVSGSSTPFFFHFTQRRSWAYKITYNLQLVA